MAEAEPPLPEQSLQGAVDWKRVAKPPIKLPFKKIENLNYALEVAKGPPFKSVLVGIRRGQRCARCAHPPHARTRHEAALSGCAPRLAAARMCLTATRSSLWRSSGS